MMRFFQAVSTNVYLHGDWCYLPESEKPHHIVILQFSEVVKSRANEVWILVYYSGISNSMSFRESICNSASKSFVFPSKPFSPDWVLDKTISGIWLHLLTDGQTCFKAQLSWLMHLTLVKDTFIVHLRFLRIWLCMDVRGTFHNHTYPLE